MIDGERRGPYELDELAEAGVRPSTYVWCKGMTDWEKAEDVADICRMFRGRLYDLLHPKAPDNANAGYVGNSGNDPTELPPPRSRFDQFMQDSRLPSIEEIEAGKDYSQPPKNMVWPSILVTLLAFTPCGILAIIFAVASQRCWKKGNLPKQTVDLKTADNNSGKKPKTPEEWRRMAHEYCRVSKMWFGINFFMAFLILGMVFSRLL